MPRRHRIAKDQCTFGQLDGIQTIRGLTGNQRKIVSLVNCDLCQADIAKKLKVSRAYVCQVIKRLESIGLIQPTTHYPEKKGIRKYTKFYELSPDLKSRIDRNIIQEPFTACRVHNIRKKFQIVLQSGAVSKDKRASYTKSWSMRGGERYKFWYSGKAGMPSCTVDVHPKTIVIYVDKGQEIPAKTIEEAKEIAWAAVYQARDKFVEQQSQFGVRFDISHAGEDIARIHGGFAIGETTAKEGVTVPGWWIDRSDTKEMSYAEAETDNTAAMSRLDRTIKLSETLETLPEMFKGMIDPIHSEINALSAHIQGGNTIQYQINQQNTLILKLIEHITNLEKRLGGYI